MKSVEKMTYSELLEAQSRQKKLLANRSFLEKLPDKGEKLLESQLKIEAQIKKFEQEEAELTTMFSGMKVDVDRMEWTGKVPAPNTTSPPPKTKNEEGDEQDIVNILCTTNEHSKIVVDERGTPSPGTSTQEKFYQHLTEKVEHLHPNDGAKFKPFKSLKHEKAPQSAVPPNWENTAATPPLYKHNGIIPINIDESLNLQIKTEEKLKDLELQRSKANAFRPVVAASRFLPDAAPTNLEDEEEEVLDHDFDYDRHAVVNYPASDPMD